MTLKQVEGATFHDGMPITSKDVAFSIKTVKENHRLKILTFLLQGAQPQPRYQE